MNNRHMQRNLRLTAIALLTLPVLNADVTLRYESKVSLNPSLPAALTEPMMKGLNLALPMSMAQQYRNGKLAVSFGKINVIVDLNKHEITLLDPDGKRYATVSADKYADAVSGAVPDTPAQAQAMLASMKGHSESKLTGRTETIQGIEAEEREVLMTLDAPSAPGLPPGTLPPGPMMRMVMHVWTAKGSEALRVSALREIAGYGVMSLDMIDPVSTIQKAFRQLPGLGDGIASLQKDLQSGGSPVMLRMQMEMFMPMLGAIAKQLPPGAANPFGAGFDPDAALMQMTEELTELSTTQISDSAFQIPDGYQAVSVADILRANVPQQPAPPAK